MAIINPPWRFDPLQMPVNVSWGNGYFLQVQLDWSDKVVVRNPTEGSSLAFTIIPSNVVITNDAPSGMLIYDHTTVIPVVEAPGQIANFYLRVLVFDVGALMDLGHALAINFQATEQDDDTTNYFPGSWSNTTGFLGITTLFPDTQDINPSGGTGLLVSGTGPWVGSGMSLFSKSIYKFDPTSGNILPKNPANAPGPASGIQWISGSRFGNGGTFTTPSTDKAYYQPSPGPSFSFPPNVVIGGGGYSTVGFLRHGGTLGISMANIQLGSGNQTIPAVWPSAPDTFQLDNVPGFPLNFSPGPYGLPNPPPPYSVGVYTIFPDPNNGPYQSGGPPIPSNAYTGTYPGP
jgi:hypothetical protein